MAGPLGVSHLMLFSRSEAGNINLRIAIAPRGPTLNFRVDKYSLCKDIIKSQKHSKAGGGGIEHLTPPLLVMNNFTTPANVPTTTTSSGKPAIPKHLESLTTSVFQSLFPPISPQATPLTSIRRVLLLDRTLTPTTTTDPSGAQNTSYILHLRHYAITSKPLTTLSRGLRRLRAAEKYAVGNSQKKMSITGTSSTSNPTSSTQRKAAHGALPNLNRLTDIGDYLLDGASAVSGYASASETEMDTDAEVEVLESSTRRVLSARDRQKKAALASAATGTSDMRNTSGSSTRPTAQKRAIKLTELGPRMTLRLVKVEEGVCAGKVLWHEYIARTKEEEKALEKVWDQRRREKEERRRVQRENVARKKKGERGRGRKGGEGGEEDRDQDEDEEMWSDDEYDAMRGGDGDEDEEEHEDEEE